jgi:hypothetical protein
VRNSLACLLVCLLLCSHSRICGELDTLCLMPTCAGECRKRYKDLVKQGRKQGLTELQLMRAAVDASGCSSVAAAAPVAQDAEATRLSWLVSAVPSCSAYHQPSHCMFMAPRAAPTAI